LGSKPILWVLDSTRHSLRQSLMMMMMIMMMMMVVVVVVMIMF
jgi:hypothetical protein